MSFGVTVLVELADVDVNFDVEASMLLPGAA